MPQSLSRLMVHLVFSTRGRQRSIQDDLRGELHAYLVSVFQAYDSPSLITNSEPDHVHSLFVLSKTRALAQVVEAVKTSSSKWMKSKGPAYAHFYWQGGYGAYAVSESQREEVMRYIANQREHHQRMSFQHELRTLFQLNGVAYDERYLWE